MVVSRFSIIIVPLPASVKSSTNSECGSRPVHDMSAFHAALHRFDRAFHFGNHAFGERARRDEFFAFFHCHFSDERSFVGEIAVNARHIGQKQQFGGAQFARDGRLRLNRR
jgi:hypothetical protein